MKTTDRAESPDIRFLRLYGKLDAYITAACMSFSRHFTAITADDLKQECAERLLTILREKRYDLNDFRLMELFKRTVYNLLKDRYRFHMTRKQVEPTAPLPDEWEDDAVVPAVTETAEDDLVYETYREQILDRLGTEIERQLFNLMVHPDARLMKFVDRSQPEVRILRKDYAARLGVSPATLSRVVQKVETTTLAVLTEDRSGR